MNIRMKTKIEMFEDYEKSLAAYMKANGTYKVKYDLTRGELMLVNELRKQVQENRDALITQLQEA